MPHSLFQHERCKDSKYFATCKGVNAFCWYFNTLPSAASRRSARRAGLGAPCPLLAVAAGLRPRFCANGMAVACMTNVYKSLVPGHAARLGLQDGPSGGAKRPVPCVDTGRFAVRYGASAQPLGGQPVGRTARLPEKCLHCPCAVLVPCHAARGVWPPLLPVANGDGGCHGAEIFAARVCTCGGIVVSLHGVGLQAAPCLRAMQHSTNNT